jgi:beta-lactamase regulating signal transducer with metallopeptidase domain
VTTAPEWIARVLEAPLRHAVAMTWQFGLLALVVLAADSLLLRRFAWPRVRLALHGLLLLKLLLPTDLAWEWSVAGRIHASTAEFAPHVEVAAGAATAGAAAMAAMAATIPPQAVLAAAALWLIGAGSLLTRGIRRVRGERRRLLRDGAPPPAELLAMARSAAATLGVRRLPDVRVSASATSPYLMGGGAPLLVVPRRVLHPSRSTELRHALLHEMAHLRRGDLTFAAVAWLACVVWWFHPLAWRVARRAAALRELCCDETVMAASRAEADGYLGTIRNCARRMMAPDPGSQAAAALSFLSEGPALLVRLEALARRRRPQPRRERMVALVITLAVGAALLPMAAPAAAAEARRTAPQGGDSLALRMAALSAVNGSLSAQRPPGCLRLHYAVAYLRAGAGAAAAARIDTKPIASN